MTDAYFVDPAAMQHDAEQLARWRAELESMADALAVDGVSDTLAGIPGAREAFASVQQVATALQSYLRDGAGELDAIGSKLTESLRIYTEAENTSADEVARVARELDSL